MFQLRNFLLIAGQLSIAAVIAKASVPAPDGHQIDCEFFDETNCRQHGDCKPRVEHCIPESDKMPHCYALWSLEPDTGETKIKMKGCFTNMHECNRTECVNNPEPRKTHIYYCCCKGSMCNTEYRMAPTPEPTTEVPNINNAETLDLNILLICCALVALTILVFSIGGWYIIFYSPKKGFFNKIEKDEVDTGNTSPLLCHREIQLLERKASGRFGDVWLAKLHNQDVAVKIFHPQEKESWSTEIEVYKLPRIRHPNILEFLGHEKHAEKPEYWLISVYHSHGSLCDYLKSHTLTFIELCKIAESMASGLAHLHEGITGNKLDDEKPQIAHRDFKSKNVLLKADLTACIADFGLAKIFYPSRPCGDTHGQVGTRRYMAPEVLEGSISFNIDSFLRIDIYACALVLWEMVSRCDIVGEPEEYLLPFEAELGIHPSLDQVQESVITNKLRPKILEAWREHEGLKQICQTMEDCWDHDPEARLTAPCIKERIVLINLNPAPLELIRNHIVNIVDDAANNETTKSL